MPKPGGERPNAHKGGGKGAAGTGKVRKSKGAHKNVSVNKRIRDLTRLLEKKGETMPVEIKEAKEKELQQLKSRATRKEQIETERRMAKKYKLLKFIERQKVGRKIRHVERELKNTGDNERDELEKELLKHKEDLLYIAFYPKSQPYIALFPKNPEKNTQTIAKKAAIRQKILKMHRNDMKLIKDGTIRVAGDDEKSDESSELFYSSSVGLGDEESLDSDDETAQQPTHAGNDDFFL